MTPTGTRRRIVALVSPFALYAGHHFEWTKKLATHLSLAEVDLQIFTTAGRKYYSESIPFASVTQISTRFFHKLGNLNICRNSILFKVTQNLETVLCGLAAWTQSSRVSAVYWTDARHYVMLIFVLLMRRQRHVHIVMGGVPYSQQWPNKILAALYRNSFASGRLIFIAETDAVRESWRRIAGNYIRTIPFAIDDLVLTPPTLTRASLKIAPNEFVCLMFGTHRSDKDYPTVVKAASMSKSKPFLLFAGPLISENDPRLILDRARYSNSHVIIRHVSEAEVTDLFRLSDCAILPYAKKYDKGSAVLLQACQHNVPVVVARSGHLQRFVDHHHTGRCYTPEDSRDLALTIDQLAEIKTKDSSHWFPALAACRKQYSWESLIKKHLDALFCSAER